MQAEKEEVVLALHGALLQYKLFFHQIDCRAYAEIVSLYIQQNALLFWYFIFGC